MQFSSSAIQQFCDSAVPQFHSSAITNLLKLKIDKLTDWTQEGENEEDCSFIIHT